LSSSDLKSDVDVQFIGRPSPTAPRIQAGGHPCQGLYWTPKGQRPRTALIATHYNVDFAEHYSAAYFAARGFGFLGWNTRFRGAEDQFILEHALIDIGVGVHWLREEAGVERVVILGNSGGGSLMGAYQAEATQPTLAGNLRGAGADALARLPGADLYVSLNAHKGRPEVLTDWMDASVVDEFDPTRTDPALDPFDPGNGPPYKAAGVPDILFPRYRTWADLRFMDPAIDPSDRPCPGCYRGFPPDVNRLPGIGRVNSLKTWLSMWSLETSNCQGGAQLAKIDLPALVVQSTGDMGVFPSDAHGIHAAITSSDKVLEMIPGAHYFEDSEANRTAMIDLVSAWIEAQ